MVGVGLWICGAVVGVGLWNCGAVVGVGLPVVLDWPDEPVPGLLGVRVPCVEGGVDTLGLGRVVLGGVELGPGFVVGGAIVVLGLGGGATVAPGAVPVPAGFGGVMVVPGVVVVCPGLGGGVIPVVPGVVVV